MGAPQTRDVAPGAWRRGLLLLALLGLATRAGFLLEHARDASFGALTLDQHYYGMAARLIATGADLHPLGGFRPLLYPFFLAGCERLLGEADGIALAIILQHLGGIATGLLVAALGARLFRNRLAGLLGGALYLLAPLPLLFEGEILTEPLYALLLTLLLWLLARAAALADDRRAAAVWAVSGALTVLAAQARANALALLALFPLLALWRLWRRRRWRAAWPLWGLAGAVALLGVCGALNRSQSGHWQPLPNGGGINLYLGNRRGADGMTPVQGRRVVMGERYEDPIELWAREEYLAACRRRDADAPDVDAQAVARYWTRRALEEVRADPAAWARLMARKVWLTFWNAEPPNNKAFAFQRAAFVWPRLLPVRWVALLTLAVPGLWAAWRWGRREALGVVVAALGLYATANLCFFICDRLRYPLWPGMAALAGGGLTGLVALARAPSGGAGGRLGRHGAAGGVGARQLGRRAFAVIRARRIFSSRRLSRKRALGRVPGGQ